MREELTKELPVKEEKNTTRKPTTWQDYHRASA
jgi:hypothetical protein